MADTYLGIEHPFDPVWNEHSRVLVLGTFPSVKSRENAFYYGHPQNRFWQVLAMLFGEPTPATVEEKRAMLLRNGVALWDVLASCDITGSADGTIRNPVPNDIASLLRRAPIRQVFANGQTAANFYRKYCLPQTSIEAIPLPSTSPANAAWSVRKLAVAWQALLTADGDTLRP